MELMYMEDSSTYLCRKGKSIVNSPFGIHLIAKCLSSVGAPSVLTQVEGKKPTDFCRA